MVRADARSGLMQPMTRPQCQPYFCNVCIYIYMVQADARSGLMQPMTRPQCQPYLCNVCFFNQKVFHKIAKHGQHNCGDIFILKKHVSLFASLLAYFQCITGIGPTILSVQLCSPLAQTIVVVHHAMLG